MLFVRAYPRESQEMVFDAHDRAFAFFKGACTRGIYDIEPLLRHWSERQWRGKTAVDAILVGKDRDYNRRFQQMCGHYLVEPWPARRRRAGRRGRSRTRSARSGSVLLATGAGPELRRAECLARRPLRPGEGDQWVRWEGPLLAGLAKPNQKRRCDSTNALARGAPRSAKARSPAVSSPGSTSTSTSPFERVPVCRPRARFR